MMTVFEIRRKCVYILFFLSTSNVIRMRMRKPLVPQLTSNTPYLKQQHKKLETFFFIYIYLLEYLQSILVENSQ